MLTTTLITLITTLYVVGVIAAVIFVSNKIATYITKELTR